jgi:probable F420-dependent oxidoreductase
MGNMQVDAILGKHLTQAAGHAKAVEAQGYDGVWIGETQHDPFLLSLRAGDATDRITVGTSIAIAFARTPMTLAYSAYDLALCTRGRFVLGLGSQIKPHIERRFSMPWSHPAPRMRELILAMRAIWDSWQHGRPLDFQGEFYTHTLMTPFFTPPAHEFGPPPIYLAGVGERMTEVAGEVCDGFFFHPFTTERYLREVTLPALERGRKRVGLSLDGFAVAGLTFAAAGRDAAELSKAIKGTKAQIAFYASTPAYRGVLDLHGWGDLQPELTALTKQGRWSELGDRIDDEILHAIAVVGDPETVATGLRQRYAGAATRISPYAPYETDPAVWADVLNTLHQSG